MKHFLKHKLLSNVKSLLKQRLRWWRHLQRTQNNTVGKIIQNGLYEYVGEGKEDALGK